LGPELQPEKVWSTSGLALRVTEVGVGNAATQVPVFPAAHAIFPGEPAGVDDDVTRLVPVAPATLTVILNACVKVTLAVRSAFTVTEHVPVAPTVPVAAQAPPQLVTRYPADGVAVKVTVVPAGMTGPLLQVPGQVTPPTLDVTVPDPVTVRAAAYKDVKVAPAVCAADIVSAQVAPADAQAPDQAVETVPLVGVTDRVTAVPEAKDALQVAETQERPLGLDVTVAGPLAVNVSVKVDGAMPLKATLAVWSADMVTVHVAAVPELAQAPPHPDT